MFTVELVSPGYVEGHGSVEQGTNVGSFETQDEATAFMLAFMPDNFHYGIQVRNSVSREIVANHRYTEAEQREAVIRGVGH